MNRKILTLAKKKLNILEKKYTGFSAVGLDDWRGYRFIFDTADVKICINGCNNCPLYNLLKIEKKSNIASLYPASKEDKKLFGPQKFLNCKTLKQYEQCYIRFLLEKANTKKEIRQELQLIKNFRILYSRDTKNTLILERQFRNNIVTAALRQTNTKKAEIIRSIVKFWPLSKIGSIKTNKSCLNNKYLIRSKRSYL